MRGNEASLSMELAERIKEGLEAEGMGDLGNEIVNGGASGGELEEFEVKRRKAFGGKKIMVPTILYREGKRKYRPLDYEADVLAAIDFEKFSYRKADEFNFADYDVATRSTVRVDIADSEKFALGSSEPQPEALEPASLDRPALIRRMLDVVPNPWQGARILDETLDKLRQRADEAKIVNSRLTLIDHMIADLQLQLEAAAEAAFRAKVKSGDIVFKLLATPLDELNYTFDEVYKIHVSSGDDKAPLLREHGTPLQRSLYETAFKKHVNGFEKDVALYLDGSDAVTWWWRIAARREWGLQGWMKHKVYPDFLVHLDAERDVARLLVLETKGKHLEGNADTEFKKKFFDLLEKAYTQGKEAGELELFADRPDAMRFRILIQPEDDSDAWKPELEKALA
jgi:type III restriction enzyme